VVWCGVVWYQLQPTKGLLIRCGSRGIKRALFLAQATGHRPNALILLGPLRLLLSCSSHSSLGGKVPFLLTTVHTESASKFGYLLLKCRPKEAPIGEYILACAPYQLPYCSLLYMYRFPPIGTKFGESIRNQRLTKGLCRIVYVDIYTK
jgi:hypothetical protein